MPNRPARAKVQITDTIPGANTIERVAKNEWLVVQRHYGDGLDNAQNPSWLSGQNAGAPVKVRIRIRWAEFRWMGLRKNIYLQRGKSYTLVQGQSTPTESVYEFTLPSGASRFGPAPWYTNEDAARFIKRLTRRSPACAARSIGKTAEGRDIPCLTIDFGGRPAKKNVVITGRIHAFETAGSWAVEGAADYLLSPGVPKAWLDRYAFHLFPTINPDGVANGLKQTRLGPVQLYDMEQGGVASDDPTIRAFRDQADRFERQLIDRHVLPAILPEKEDKDGEIPQGEKESAEGNQEPGTGNKE